MHRTVNNTLMDAPECISLLMVQSQVHRMRDQSPKAEQAVKDAFAMSERIYGHHSYMSGVILTQLAELVNTGEPVLLHGALLA